MLVCSSVNFVSAADGPILAEEKKKGGALEQVEITGTLLKPAKKYLIKDAEGNKFICSLGPKSKINEEALGKFLKQSVSLSAKIKKVEGKPSQIKNLLTIAAAE